MTFEVKEIGGKTFKVVKMAATDSLKYLIRIGKFMEGIDELLKEGGDDLKIAGLLKFIGSLDEKETVQLAKELVEMTNCDGDKTIADQHLDGVLELAQVCVFVIEVNYGNFFGGKEGESTVQGIVKNFSPPKK